MHVELSSSLYEHPFSGLHGRKKLIGNPCKSLMHHCVRLGHQFEIYYLDFALNYEIEFILLHSYI